MWGDIPRNSDRPRGLCFWSGKRGDQDPPGLSQPLRVTARAQRVSLKAPPKATTQTRALWMPLSCCPGSGHPLSQWLLSDGDHARFGTPHWAIPEASTRGRGCTSQGPCGGNGPTSRGISPALSLGPWSKANLLSSQSGVSAASGELPDRQAPQFPPQWPCSSAQQMGLWPLLSHFPDGETEAQDTGRMPRGGTLGATGSGVWSWGSWAPRGTGRPWEVPGWRPPGAGVGPVGRMTCRISGWRHCFRFALYHMGGTWSLEHPPGWSLHLLDGRCASLPGPLSWA